MSGSALAELWEALGELWEALYIEKLPINRPSGRYVRLPGLFFVMFSRILQFCADSWSRFCLADGQTKPTPRVRSEIAICV